MTSTIQPIPISQFIHEHNRGLESKRDINRWFLREYLTIDFGDYIGRPSKLITMQKEYLSRFLENGWTIYQIMSVGEDGRWSTTQVTSNEEATNGTTGGLSVVRGAESSSTSKSESSDETQKTYVSTGTATSSSTSGSTKSGESKSSTDTEDIDRTTKDVHDKQHTVDEQNGETYTDATHTKNVSTGTSSDNGKHTSSSSSSASGKSSSSSSSESRTDPSESSSENTNESWTDPRTDKTKSKSEHTSDAYTDEDSYKSNTKNTSNSIDSSYGSTHSSSSSSEQANENRSVTTSGSTHGTDVTSSNKGQSTTESGTSSQVSTGGSTTTEDGSAYWATVQRIKLTRRRMQPEYVLQDMIDSYVNQLNTGFTNEDARFNELVTLYGVLVNRNETEGNALVSKALDVTWLFDSLSVKIDEAWGEAGAAASEFRQYAVDGSTVEIRYKFEETISHKRSQMVGQGTYNGTVWPTVEAGILRQMEAAIAEAKAKALESVSEQITSLLNAKGDIMTRLVNAKNSIASAIDQRKITATELRNTVTMAMINFIGSREDAYPQIQEISNLASQIGFTVGAAGNVL